MSRPFTLVVMKDFSRDRARLEFTIDGDHFEAASALPAQTLMDFAAKFDKIDEQSGPDQIDSMMSILEAILLPESYPRFTARMADKERPIELAQVNEVVEWVMAEHGLRPTEQSGDSSSGSASPDDGTKSTGAAPAVVSISSASPPTGS